MIDDIQWHSSLDVAADLAARQGRLVVVMGLLNGMGEDDAW